MAALRTRTVRALGWGWGKEVPLPCIEVEAGSVTYVCRVFAGAESG